MDLKQQIITEQAKKVCKTYKISEDAVQSLLKNGIDKDPSLTELIQQAERPRDVYRTRTFKDFIKKVKKEIYYDLRTYKQEADNLVDSHISSRERAPYLDDLFKQISGYLEQAEVVLDLGGGVFPASFPFHQFPKLKKYVWVDKDKQAYENLKDQDLKNTLLYNFSVGENPWEYYLPENKESFDFVFMLKLIPVMYRQHREQLGHITKLPFKHALVTGSKEAMVKKQDIENRENKIITKFISDSGWNIVKKIDLPNEFGYIIE